MAEEYWPHKFTKNGAPKQVGEEQIYDHTKAPIMAQPMVCVCCHVEYVHNQTPQPQGACPARKTETEMKRLLRD